MALAMAVHYGAAVFRVPSADDQHQFLLMPLPYRFPVVDCDECGIRHPTVPREAVSQ